MSTQVKSATTPSEAQAAVNRAVLARILLGSLAVGGAAGALKSYGSYVNSSFVEDESLRKSVRDVKLPLRGRKQAPRKARRRFDPAMFMDPPAGEQAPQTSPGIEDSVGEESPSETVGDAGLGWGGGDSREETTSEDESRAIPKAAFDDPTNSVVIGTADPWTVAAVPALAYGGYRFSEVLTEKLLSKVKKAEQRRQVAEAQAAYNRALERERAQVQEKVAADAKTTWTPGAVIGTSIMGAPLLTAVLSALATDRLLSATYPALKRNLPTTVRLNRVAMPDADVLEEDGTPATELVSKVASTLAQTDALESLYRAVLSIPGASHEFLADLVKCAAAGGLARAEEVLAKHKGEAMWKYASAFRGFVLTRPQQAVALHLLMKSACAQTATLYAVAVFNDTYPGMAKVARELYERDPVMAQHAEGAHAALGVLARGGDLQGVLSPEEGLDKLASSGRGEREELESFLDFLFESEENSG